jgi:hypothetical protein
MPASPLAISLWDRKPTAMIYQYANNGGGTPTVFVTLPGAGTGGIRQIFFDPGSTFGGDMLVVTNGGYLYEYNSSGVNRNRRYTSVRTPKEWISPPGTWGKYAGQLLIGSEGSQLASRDQQYGCDHAHPG